MPFPTDPLFYAIGWAATFVMAFAKGAFGGGLAILGIPLLAFVVSPLDAAVMVSPLVLFMDFFALNAFGPSTWSKPDLAWLTPGLVAGIAAGALMFVYIDPRLMALIIALVTLVFTLHWFLRGRHAPPRTRPVSPPLALAAGAAGGFTTFIAHAGGPPVAMYLLARGLGKTTFAGTSIAVFMLGNFLKTFPYVGIGLHKPSVLWAAVALAPVVPFGVYAGRWLHDRLEQKALFFWCYLLLAAAALKLLYDAVRAFLA